MELTLQVQGDNDHPGIQFLYSIGDGNASVMEDLIAKPLAEFYLRWKDEVGIIELKSHPKLVTQVDRFYFQPFVWAAGAGIGCQVEIELAAYHTIEPEIMYPVAFEL